MTPDHFKNRQYGTFRNIFSENFFHNRENTKIDESFRKEFKQYKVIFILLNLKLNDITNYLIEYSEKVQLMELVLILR